MADTWKEDKVGASIINKTKKKNFGYSDPSGEYPLPEHHYQSSVFNLTNTFKIKSRLV